MLSKLIIPSKHNNYIPILLRKGTLIIYAVLILSFNFLIANFETSKLKAAITNETIVNLHNVERAKKGLQQLKVNSILNQSAFNKAKAMLATNCWDHYCPKGTSPWQYFKDVGYRYIYAGENLGEGFTNENELFAAWLNSPSHSVNIFNSQYSEIGVGIVSGSFQGRKNSIIVVVHFGAPILPAPQTSNVPRPNFLTIQTPKNNQIIFKRSIEITGTVKDVVDFLRIFINNDLVAEINVNKSFSALIDELVEGEYDITIEAFNSKREKIEIDNIKNVKLNVKEFIVQDEDIMIDKGEKLDYLLELNLENKDIEIEKIETDGKTFEYTSPLWKTEISQKELGEKDGILLIITSKEGEIYEYFLPASKFEFVKEKIFPLSSDFDIYNLKSFIALGFIFYLFILFSVDYLVLLKTNMILQTRQKFHLKVGGLLVVFTIFILASNGTILTGLSL